MTGFLIRINIYGVDNIKIIHFSLSSHHFILSKSYLIVITIGTHYELTAVKNTLSGLDLCLNFSMFFSSDWDFKLSYF